MENKVSVTYVSEWEWGDPDHIIETDCVLDLTTGVLTPETVDCEVDWLVREYIVHEDEEYPVIEYKGDYLISKESLTAIKDKIRGKNKNEKNN